MAMAKVGGTNTQLSACAAVPHWQELGQTAQNRCSCASHMVLLACRHKQRWNIQSFLFRAIFIWTWQLNCINLEDCLESTGFPLLRKATSCTYPFHIGFRNHEKEKETVPPKKKPAASPHAALPSLLAPVASCSKPPTRNGWSSSLFYYQRPCAKIPQNYQPHSARRFHEKVLHPVRSQVQQQIFLRLCVYLVAHPT